MQRTLWICVWMLTWAASSAAQVPRNDYARKARFVLNVAKFVRWPKDRRRSSESFRIGLLGRDPFGDTIDRLFADKTVHGKPVRLIRFAELVDDVERLEHVTPEPTQFGDQ